MKKIGDLNFRTKAKLINILGEQLIRDNSVGLIELVKNSYDADAEHVKVSLINTNDPESTQIVVEDDGDGMTEEIIKGPWFEAAGGYKEQQKSEGRKTPKGRMLLGEKGVGRFSTQKLGKKLELVTRPVGQPEELVLNIDWNEYEAPEKYIEEIDVPLYSRIPQIFKGKDEHGTRLTMISARDSWKRKEIEKFQIKLIRLVTPSKAPKNFEIIFECPEYSELQSLDSSNILENFQFYIEGCVDREGKLTFVYKQRKQNKEIIEIQGGQGDENVWGKARPTEWTHTIPRCGPFKIRIAAWLLKKEELDNCGVTKEQIKGLSGVSIYREGFRILPYGDEGDDWLGLDLRRVNLKQAFSNNQVIGVLEIDETENPELKDKTNREGLQENKAYYDFRDIVLGILSIFERESLEERRTINKFQQKKEKLEETVKKVVDENKELKTKIAEIEKKNEEQKLKDYDPHQPENKDSKADEFVQIKVADFQEIKSKADNFSSSTEEIQKAVTDIITELEDSGPENRDVYLHLMGIGLAAERFAHEFDRYIGLIDRCMKNLSKTDMRSKDDFIDMDVYFNGLKNEVRLMDVCRYVKRKQESSETSVKEIVDLTFNAHADEIKAANIKIDLEGEPFNIIISKASLAQVIDNIVSNSVYWLMQNSEVNNRKLHVKFDKQNAALTFSNTGPYIDPKIKKRLFTVPFTTTKPNGRGLGMYIATEILKKYTGEIQFLDEKDDENKYQMAAFKVTFK